jgi:hypothetical protein
MGALGPRRIGALIVVSLVWSVVGLTPGATQGVTATPQPEYSPPPREASPFTSEDSFCTPDANQFDAVKPDDPRLSTTIPVVMLVPGSASAAATPLPAGDPGDAARAFGELVNECGGIGGRKLDFHVLVESGRPLDDCLAATQQLHAFIVVSFTASPAESCIARDQQTIMVTESDLSNESMTGTQGRLVGTGSAEGVLQAQVLDLLDSGRLDGKHVAIVAATSPPDATFARSVAKLLLAHKIPLSSRAKADVILVPRVDPATLPSLLHGAASDPRRKPLEVYGFSETTNQSIDQLRQVGGIAAAKLLDTAGVYTYNSSQDEEARLGQSPGQFATMCNKAYAAEHGPGVAAADLPQPSPPAPSDVAYLQVAKICLAMRVVARGLFNAGVDPTQQSTVKALHKLPYIDNELPDGTPKPRPNQVVNEPVERVEQVVVLSRAEYPCTRAGLLQSVCWAPATGWDDGGRAVNAPLAGSALASIAGSRTATALAR